MPTVRKIDAPLVQHVVLRGPIVSWLPVLGLSSAEPAEADDRPNTDEIPGKLHKKCARSRPQNSATKLSVHRVCENLRERETPDIIGITNSFCDRLIDKSELDFLF